LTFGKNMRSEFQLLQSEVDERDFVYAFTGSADALEKASESEWIFRVGDCPIQFWRSKRSERKIAVGRISIATHGFGVAYESAEKAEALFKKMRGWLKKRYTNRLIARNLTLSGVTASYRMMWLGPDARAMHRGGQVTLRSMVSDLVVIEEEPNQAPEPTALAVTPRACARVAPSSAVAHL
jgi:hypothetical protein